MSVEQKLEDVFLATGGGKVEGGETVRIGGSEVESELKQDFQNFGMAVLWCLEMINTLHDVNFNAKIIGFFDINILWYSWLQFK